MITRILTIFISVFLIASVASCKFKKSNEPLPRLEYLDGTAKFDVDNFFNSDLKGFAIILDENEKIIDKIEMNAKGSWSGTKGTVKFEYIHKNDRKDYRTWLITKKSSENFSIVGHDFIGSANGRQAGNVAEILYKMNYKFMGQEKEIEFVDNIYQTGNDAAVTITELYHDGDLVGKIIGSFIKVRAYSAGSTNGS